LSSVSVCSALRWPLEHRILAVTWPSRSHGKYARMEDRIPLEADDDFMLDQVEIYHSRL
jgi:hypothetical protein